MTISFNVDTVNTATGKVKWCFCEAVIMHSPREGLDNGELRQLEKDLGEMATERINAMIDHEEEREYD